MLSIENITIPYKRAKICQRKGLTGHYQCNYCKSDINMSELYYAIGLRASTTHERFYSRNGCVWYKYCKNCAER